MIKYLAILLSILCFSSCNKIEQLTPDANTTPQYLYSVHVQYKYATAVVYINDKPTYIGSKDTHGVKAIYINEPSEIIIIKTQGEKITARVTDYTTHQWWSGEIKEKIVSLYLGKIE